MMNRKGVSMKVLLLTTLVLSAVLLAEPGAAEEPQLERNKEVVRLNAQAVNDRDLALLAKTTSETLVRHCQATPGLNIASLEEFVAFLKTDWATFPDSRITIQQLVAEGDRVAIFATYEGTQKGQMGPFPPSGKRMSLEVSGVFRIEDGKIAEIWVTWDNMAALTQLGHLPPPSEGGGAS